MEIKESSLEKKSEKGKFVRSMFDQANFDIDKFPKLLERLTELAEMENSHFDDAAIMSMMVGEIFENLKKSKNWEFDINQIKLAALFHDIGKSGPVSFEKEDRRLFQQFFNPKLFYVKEFENRDIRKVKVAEAIAYGNLENKTRIINLMKFLDIDIEHETMIEFWRRHDDWTYDLLIQFSERKPGIPTKIIDVSSSHHILDGKNPAGIDLDEIPIESKALEAVDKYQIILLSLIDKYEAAIRRGKKSHAEAIKELEQTVKENTIINEKQKQEYLAIIKILDENEGKLISVFKKYFNI